ncbi:MAG TPA: sodium-dependent bicarbonate transport family permease, partial [Thermoanaerobaculia bacterium]|nr:sodium-dependent bicarbonate transport family permease [Thermoanaerobaculia bacterium]
ISAVTFITAASFLAQQQIPFGGHMVAAMALMESPAVVVGVVLARYFGGRPDETARRIAWPELLRDSFLNGSVFLLIGSMFVGGLAGEAGNEAMRPLTEDLFKGLLAFFLLDMGIIAAGRARALRRSGAFLLAFAIVVPLFNAGVGLGLAKLAGMGEGDALMFTILCASASYIAVPAAVRIAIPEANPTLYISTALAVTFPFNIVIGIPLYMGLIRAWWG